MKAIDWRRERAYLTPDNRKPILCGRWVGRAEHGDYQLTPLLLRSPRTATRPTDWRLSYRPKGASDFRDYGGLWLGLKQTVAEGKQHAGYHHIEQARRPRTVGRTVYLVGCAKTQRDGTHPAAKLYASTLFRLARAYVQASGREWLILSGKHGIIPPHRPTEKYDEPVPMVNIRAEEWAIMVVEQLRERYGLEPLRLVILAGLEYVIPVRERALAHWVIEDPMKGLEVGQRQHWLKAHAADFKRRKAVSAEQVAFKWEAA